MTKKDFIKIENDFNKELSKLPLFHPLRLAAEKYHKALQIIFDELSGVPDKPNCEHPLHARMKGAQCGICKNFI